MEQLPDFFRNSLHNRFVGSKFRAILPYYPRWSRTGLIITQSSSLAAYAFAFFFCACLALTGGFYLGITETIGEIQFELTAFKIPAGPDKLPGEIAGRRKMKGIENIADGGFYGTLVFQDGL